MVLNEALADITTDANERRTFEFRTFTRKANGQPKKVTITAGRIYVDGVLVDTLGSVGDRRVHTAFLDEW